jgi:predicted nucleic acid-binding protein
MIVSDSTAIITLININEFELLKFFASKIIIPTEVYREISIQKDAKIFLDRETKANFLEVVSGDNNLLFDELHILLDRGESAAIVLAAEKNIPLLIDEKKGRRVARNLGIEIVGLIGIIRFLYRRKEISRERTKILLEKLNASNFRVSKKLMALVLE